MWNKVIEKESDWAEIAKRVVADLKYPILLLHGNLGAGKTTFTKYLMKELGSPDKVTSPTFSIVNEYRCPQGDVFHFDLYRLESEEEVFDIGIDDYLGRAFLSIIEWPEVFEEQIEEHHHEMTIKVHDAGRQIEFK